MALKLLNPGLRPLGLFDLDDDDAGALVGGEFVELTDDDNAVEAYAADAGQLTRGGSVVSMKRDGRTAGRLGGLADEGTDEYGTLFGSLIGANAGRATQQSGAVVIGPSTDRASGKVTVWATAGLYGVTDQDDELDSAISNAQVYATAATGLLRTTADGTAQVGTYVGAMSDSSLVSTTNAAAGLDAGTEYHAIFYLGNASAIDATA
jgi:hypothetical protein